MTSKNVAEGARENGVAAPAAEDDQGNDKGETEIEIQNNEYDLEALVDEDEEKDRPRRRSWDRVRGREKRNSRDRERDRDRDRGRRRSRSQERISRRDQARRDPNKSSKDIEQDKARAKKDNDTKALAEKEKAIKTLLDSNNVVPPGTEEEAIQIIVDKSQQQQKNDEDSERLRSRENRKRSPVHNRLGIRRSPRRKSKSPIKFSPKRRSPSSDRRRRSPAFYDFFTHKRSNDKDGSAERRELSRRRLRERRDRERSRSRDRHRSRSMDRGRRSRSYDRRRSRSFDRRRRSRSYERHSPRRRRSPTRSRSPTRQRRRSPFINELARQFSADSLRPGPDGPPMMPLGPGGGPPPPPPYMGTPGVPPVVSLDPRMLSGGGPPGMMPIPGGPIGMPPGPMDVHPGAPMLPTGPPMMHPGPEGPPPFGGFDPVMGFDPLNRGLPAPDYGSGPIMYNPPGLPIGAPVPRPMSPQPVPAPGAPIYPGLPMQQPMGAGPVPGPKYSPNLRESPRRKLEERIRTPEPPIISDFKPNEKTSLSSLLEASVSSSTAKDTSSSMTTFKGFKPEVIRQCERALRSLPAEDPRLNMKGRFFFDPNKKLVAKEAKDLPSSNSVLLRKGRTEIHWEEEFNHMTQATTDVKTADRKRVITLQKICQTEETTRETIAVQTEELTKTDFSMQVGPDELLPPVEDRRAPNVPVDFDERRNNYEDRHSFDERSGSRHDWNMRDTFDQGGGGGGVKPPIRDSEDLRWSLSNNPNRANNPWNRGYSPPRQSVKDHMHGGPVVNPAMDIRDMDMMRDRPGMDLMRDRPGMDGVGRIMDARDRIVDRGMMEMMEREMEMRGVDMPRDRELMLELRGDGGRMDMGGRGGPISDFGARREPLDDYDLRNRFDNSFNRGPLDRPMDMDRNEPIPRGRDSPPPVMDDGDDLEIIEERVFDRDSWPRMSSGAQFNNAKGGAGIAAAMRNQPPTKRPPFRGGRIGQFRPNF